MSELPQDYAIPEEDEDLLEECKVTAFRASGPGGQHKNKTSTAVRLFHHPSGIVVIGKRERSQRRNLNAALERLRGKLESLLEKPTPRKRTRIPSQEKEKRRAQKRRRSQTKHLRGKVSPED